LALHGGIIKVSVARKYFQKMVKFSEAAFVNYCYKHLKWIKLWWQPRVIPAGVEMWCRTKPLTVPVEKKIGCQMATKNL